MAVIPAETNGTTSNGNGHGHGNSSAVLYRSLHEQPLKVVSAEGIYLELEGGGRILDATGGAAVSCLGHNNAAVKAAMVTQLDAVAYCHSAFFSTDAAEKLCRLLVDGTGGAMARAFVVSSGSEAVEACLKMARQYFVELEGGSTTRIRFIARRQSYHGTTIGALGLGGHVARRAIYEGMLSPMVSHVSPCYAYRGMREGESEEEYVRRLAGELEEEFLRVGPENVCAFVAEPMVGAALGCVPAVPGYFRAVREVCDRYGALLILDEIMCGMGRSGYLHAWQSPHVDVVPDLQAVGKGLGAGYAPVAAMLIAPKVKDVLFEGTGAFMHGQTYQGHPVSCATAYAVQRVIMEGDLVAHAKRQGNLLEHLLKKGLANNEFVGDVRGMGLFWGIEFVKEKETKEPFDPKLQLGSRLHEFAMQPPYSISLYPGLGTADGVRGDHVLLAPAYTCSDDDIRLIVDRTIAAIGAFFEVRNW